MSELKKINILRSIGKLYLSLLAFQTMNGVAAFPAETKSTKTVSKSDDSKSSSSSSDDSKSSSSTTSDSKTSTSPNKSDLGSGQVCQPNTNSCGTGESCIRFDTDKEDKFTCHKTELAFCESNDYCKKVLGDSYKHCYVPPWANGLNQKKQCFTEHGIGSTCVNDIHCANTLSCVENVCVSNSNNSTGYDFDSGAATASSGNGTILGINKWVFISVIAFPILVIIFCFWCWIIGRSSSKDIENQKKEKYENELKKLTLPSTANNNGTSDKRNSKSTTNNNSEVIAPNYVNPQKEIEEEVGKRGFRSLFSRKKKGADEAAGTTAGTSTSTATAKEATTVDISSSSKVGGKAPINTSITSDTQKKMKKNLTLVNLADKNNSGAAHARKVNGKKSPSTPVGSSKHSSVASFAQDTASNASSAATPNKAAAKARVGNKKKTGPKKASKGPSSSGNDTNNSTSSKQSSQRGLVNNASGMSSALSGQSASYFSGTSSIDAQNALYYQQMYNAAAAQAVQNQYYAAYMQNPYYAAAAQQNAAYYAAAAAAAQDPNAAALYGKYQGQTGYQ